MSSNHILVIEDDVQISQFLQSSLKANGYHTVCAHTIAEGKRLFDANKPALLILDLNLPDGDGVKSGAAVPFGHEPRRVQHQPTMCIGDIERQATIRKAIARLIHPGPLDRRRYNFGVEAGNRIARQAHRMQLTSENANGIAYNDWL